MKQSLLRTMMEKGLRADIEHSFAARLTAGQTTRANQRRANQFTHSGKAETRYTIARRSTPRRD